MCRCGNNLLDQIVIDVQYLSSDELQGVPVKRIDVDFMRYRSEQFQDKQSGSELLQNGKIYDCNVK